MSDKWGPSRNSVVWVVFLLIVVVSLVVYSTYFQRLGSPPEQRIREVVRMEVWIYSSEWEGLLRSYQQENPDVEVSIRSFQSYDALASELSAAISAGRAPDAAEISNAYGLKEWIDTGALQPIELDGHVPELTGSARTAFTYNQALWAVPVGASVPLLLYHQDKLQNAGYQHDMAFQDLNHMAEVLSSWIQGLKDRNASIKWNQTLAVDDSLSLLFMHLWGLPTDADRRTHLQELLTTWHALVFDYRVMFPLEHRLALSEFMDGQVLFLITDSQNMNWLDRYIAGKFKYGALAVPGAAGQGIAPHYSAFVVLQGGEGTPWANELVRHLQSKDVQESLIANTGYIPVREDTLASLKRNMKEADADMLLRLSESFLSIQPSEDDYRRWRLIADSLTQLEIESHPDVERMTAELLPLLP